MPAFGYIMPALGYIMPAPGYVARAACSMGGKIATPGKVRRARNDTYT
ncbi:MAG: hypothetical protein WCK35_12665 [Chloroflexota bacterium]